MNFKPNLTEAEVRDMAKKIVSAENEKQEATNQMYRSLADQITKMDSQELGTELSQIAAILALEDKKFDILAPVFLEEIAKAYNEPNNKLELARAMTAQGFTLEEAQEEYGKLLDAIDTPDMREYFSPNKITFLKQFIMLAYNALGECDAISKRIIAIPFQRLNDDVKLPTYAHETDAGMDIYALEDITIAPGETILIPTGLKVALPTGYELQVRPKSGRCLKTKLRVANAPGTIDAGYRDEIGVIIDNIDPPIKKIYTDEDGKVTGVDYGSSYTIGKGEKFAQLILASIIQASPIEVDDVATIGGNRNGGFGSTGLK